jgi:hypothetical protein
MKTLLSIFLIFSTHCALSFDGNPGLGSKMCIHHVTGKPSDSYALVTGTESCPAWVGTVVSDSGKILVEVHPKHGNPTFTPKNLPTSQHCWVEERDLGN